MSEIAMVHTSILKSKASQRFPSMIKNTQFTLVRSVFDAAGLVIMIIYSKDLYIRYSIPYISGRLAHG